MAACRPRIASSTERFTLWLKISDVDDLSSKTRSKGKMRDDAVDPVDPPVCDALAQSE